MTTGFDRSVADIAFAPDSRTLYLTAEDAGFVRLYSVPAKGDAVTSLLDSRGGATPSSTPHGRPRAA